MDKQPIHELFDQIAKEEIPDDMNLWNDIHAQLTRKPQPSFKLSLVLVRSAALVLLLTISAVSYGFYQYSNNPQDSGLAAVTQEDLLVYFDQTQDLEGDSPYEMSATLHYMYADANRIVAELSVSGTAPASDQLQLYPDVNLTTSDGQEIPYLPLGGGGGGGGGGPVDPDTLITTSTNLTMMFDSSVLEDVPDVLNLNLEVVVAYSTQEIAQDNPMGMVLGNSTLFEIELPFNRGWEMDSPQTQTVNSLDLNLEKAVVAPSLTRLEMCYELDEPQAWSPVATLRVDGETILENQTLGLTSIQNKENCRLWILPEALHSYTGEWELEILEFQSQNLTPEIMTEIQETLSAEGIEITVFEEGGFGFDSSDPIIVKRIEEVINTYREKITGPWVFTFPIGE